MRISQKATCVHLLLSGIFLASILVLSVGPVPAQLAKSEKSGLAVTVQMIDADGDGWMNEVRVAVVDNTGSPVPSARIKANGWLKGTTGTDGTVVARMFKPGKKAITASVSRNGRKFISDPITVTIKERGRRSPEKSKVARFAKKNPKGSAAARAVAAQAGEGAVIIAKRIPLAETYAIVATALVLDADGDGWMNDVRVGVVDGSNSPIPGAKVVANGWPKGTTGTDGTATVRMSEPGKKTILVTFPYKGLVVISNPVTVTILKRDRNAALIDKKTSRASLKEMKDRHQNLKSRSVQLAAEFEKVVQQTILMGEHAEALNGEARHLAEQEKRFVSKDADDDALASVRQQRLKMAEKIRICQGALDRSLRRMKQMAEQDRDLCKNIESLEKEIEKQTR